MALERRSIAEFLKRVGRDVHPIGPREYIVCERLLAAFDAQRLPPGRNALRAALASVLARDNDEWQRISALFDAIVCDAGVTGDPPERAKTSLAHAPTVRLLPEAPKTRWALLNDALRLRVRQIPEQLGNLPRSIWFAFVVSLVALFIFCGTGCPRRRKFPPGRARTNRPVPGPPPDHHRRMAQSLPNSNCCSRRNRSGLRLWRNWPGCAGG